MSRAPFYEVSVAQRVLITQLSWFGAHRLAVALERDRAVEYVLGVDHADPRGELERTEFVRVDVRRPDFLRVLEATGVDTVVHLGLHSTEREAGGTGGMHDLNVIGAMQVLAACRRSETVKRVIVRSTTAVYGAEPSSPAVVSEDVPPAADNDPFGRDAAEVEDYARELSRRRPDIDVVILRFANILGPDADTPLAEYLDLPVVPTPLGFDPRLQFVHADDVVDLLIRVIHDPVPGVFNVAGGGAVYLSQAVRTGGRVQLPVPRSLLRVSAPVLRALGVRGEIPPHILRLVQWGRVADTTRLKAVLGFSPRWSTRDTIRDFYADRRLRRAAPPRRQKWERDLHEFLVRKGQERFVAGADRGDRPGGPR